VPLEGLRQKVVELLLGDSGSDGLVRKFRLNAGALSTPEKAFMERMRDGIGAQLHNLARIDEGVAVNFALNAAPTIALAQAQLITEEMLSAVARASAFAHSAYAPKVAALISDARARLAREREALVDEFGRPEARTSACRAGDPVRLPQTRPSR